MFQLLCLCLICVQQKDQKKVKNETSNDWNYIDGKQTVIVVGFWHKG